MDQDAALAVRLLFHRLGVKDARSNPGRNLLSLLRDPPFVRGEQIVVVELAAHLRHAVLVHEVGR